MTYVKPKYVKISHSIHDTEGSLKIKLIQNKKTNDFLRFEIEMGIKTPA
jgi:hypothetical protein